MILSYAGRMPNGGLRRYGGVPVRGVWNGGRLVYFRRGKNYRVARLVCEAFHGRAPQNKPCCLHIDEDSANNTPKNLKWGTQKENLNALGFLTYCRSRTGKNNPRVKGATR